MAVEILKYFEVIEDKREPWKVKHNLLEIIFMSIVATVCKAETWQEIAAFAEEKEEWFRKYLVLENGIPSHDTFERCFRIINPKQFQKCFISWTESLWTERDGEIISIDGKTMRRTFDAACDKKAIHIVSAWASENGIVMGQVKTDVKSNEITAIPELLDLLVVEGCVVTIDAMGTQKDIAKKIRTKKAEYVLAVKENQPTLYKDIEDYFETALEDKTGDFEVEKHVQIEKGHGRVEKRIYYYSHDIKWMPQKQEWKDLRGIGMVIRESTEKGKTTKDVRYYISSIEKDIDLFAKAVRKHWGVEAMHWNLDVTFREDEMRSRKDYLPENLGALKRIALNMLKRETSVKKSMNVKRQKACLNEKYLEKVIFG